MANVNCTDCGNPDCPKVSAEPFWKACPASPDFGLPPGMEACSDCGGHGKIDMDDEGDLPCNCNGKGYVPAEDPPEQPGAMFARWQREYAAYERELQNWPRIRDAMED